MFRVGRFSPRFITPKTVHAIDTFLGTAAGLSPNRISVHIHHRKIQEHVDGAGLTCHLHCTPFKVKTVRIEEAERSLVFLVLDCRQKRLGEIFRGVACFYMDVTAAGAKLLQMRRLLGVHIDKKEAVERRCRFQRSGRAAVDLPTTSLRNVDTGTTERIDVVFLQASLVGESRGIGRAVFLDDLEL